jgi:hypothetical protein
MTPSVLTNNADETLGWSIAGQLLDAFTNRDFAAMSSCLADDVRFRALIPPGVVDVTGAEATVANFERWFGQHDHFDVIDASIGQIGTRLYLRWRINTATAGDAESRRVIEQQLFATAGERIEVLDLMCSGFQLPPG